MYDVPKDAPTLSTLTKTILNIFSYNMLSFGIGHFRALTLTEHQIFPVRVSANVFRKSVLQRLQTCVHQYSIYYVYMEALNVNELQHKGIGAITSWVTRVTIFVIEERISPFKLYINWLFPSNLSILPSLLLQPIDLLVLQFVLDLITSDTMRTYSDVSRAGSYYVLTKGNFDFKCQYILCVPNRC